MTDRQRQVTELIQAFEGRDAASEQTAQQVAEKIDRIYCSHQSHYDVDEFDRRMGLHELRHRQVIGPEESKDA